MMDGDWKEGDLLECCLFCKHWAANDNSRSCRQIERNKAKIIETTAYMQPIRYCGVKKEETDRIDVCNEFRRDSSFVNRVRNNKNGEKLLKPYTYPNFLKFGQ